MRKPAVAFWLSTMLLAPVTASAVDIAMLTFCLAKPPDSTDLAEWHKTYCPQVLADAMRANQLALEAAQQAAASTAQTQAGTVLTQQGTALTQEQTALTAKLAAEKAAIENFKAMLPAGITPSAPAAVTVDSLKHLAINRQVNLVNQVAEKIGKDLAGKLTAPTLLVNKAELEQLTKNAVDPAVIVAELTSLSSLTTNWLTACPLETKDPTIPTNSPFGFQTESGVFKSMSFSAVPLVLESLIGSVGRIASVFQTSLVGSASGDLSGEQDALIRASFVQGFGPSENLFVALAPVRSDNPVLVGLTKLREDVIKVAQSIGKFDEKAVCSKEGKALLDAIAKRLDALNAGTATAVSPISAALWRSTLNAAGPNGGKQIEQFLLINVDHSSGSIAAIKHGLRSADYVQNAAVTLSYRIQKIDGSVVLARVESGAVDRMEYDKKLIPRAQSAPPRSNAEVPKTTEPKPKS